MALAFRSLLGGNGPQSGAFLLSVAVMACLALLWFVTVSCDIVIGATPFPVMNTTEINIIFFLIGDDRAGLGV